MSSPYESPTGFQPPPPRRRIWPFALAGCAIFGLLLFALCAGLMFLGFRQVSSGGEVAEEVDRLFEDIAQGRAADFYETECSPELKQVTSQQEFVELADFINERLGKLVSKSATGFSYNSNNLVNTIEADYDCEFEHGEGTVHTKFKSEGNRWLLMTFRVNSPELVTEATEETPAGSEPADANPANDGPAETEPIESVPAEEAPAESEPGDDEPMSEAFN